MSFERVKAMLRAAASTEDRRRLTGYYWVVFPHKDRAHHWEVGSWDGENLCWVLLGSGDIWLSSQLTKIGAHIDRPSVPPG